MPDDEEFLLLTWRKFDHSPRKLYMFWLSPRPRNWFICMWVSVIPIAESPPRCGVHHDSEWNCLHDWMISTTPSRIRPAPVISASPTVPSSPEPFYQPRFSACHRNHSTRHRWTCVSTLFADWLPTRWRLLPTKMHTWDTLVMGSHLTIQKMRRCAIIWLQIYLQSDLSDPAWIEDLIIGVQNSPGGDKVVVPFQIKTTYHTVGT